MSGRFLMTTVAALALAVPALAQDPAAPQDEQAATPQAEEMQQGEGAAGGTTEQEPTVTEEVPEGATEQTPTVAEDAPEGATEQEPTLTEEIPEGGTDQDQTVTEEVPAAAPADQELAAEDAPPAGMEFLQVQEDAQYLADREVIGKDVVNEMDEKVGSIADLVMDQDQRLVGVVLSVGGFLGIGEKWVAVPVEQIDFPTADEPARLLASVTEDQLKNAPDFMTREALEAEQAATDPAMQPAPAPAAPVQ